MLMQQCCTKYSRLKTSTVVSSPVMTMCVVWYEANETLEEYATFMFKAEVGSNRFCCSISSHTWD